MALQPSIRVINGKVFGAYAAQAKNVAYGQGTVEDALDELIDEIGLKIKYFDVTVPSGSASYDFSNYKPSDFYTILSAMSIGGGSAIIRQTGASKIFFSENLSNASVIRILYMAD